MRAEYCSHFLLSNRGRGLCPVDISVKAGDAVVVCECVLYRGRAVEVPDRRCFFVNAQ